jgi:hypothetical protein
MTGVALAVPSTVTARLMARNSARAAGNIRESVGTRTD